MKKVLFLALLSFSTFAQKRNLTLSLLPDSYAVCRLAPDAKDARLGLQRFFLFHIENE